MEVRFVSPDIRRLDELKGEVLALPFFEDERPLRGALGLIDWRLCGRISRMLLNGRVSGALAERILIPAQPRLPFQKLMLFGSGCVDALDDAVFSAVIEDMLTTLDRARVRQSVIALPGRALDKIRPEVAMRIFLGRSALHPEQDQVTLIEPPEAQREMLVVFERERRRERSELDG